MNIASIKELVEAHTDHELQQAEADILEGKDLSIMVPGEDEGEQLTHILAALWVIQNMKESFISQISAWKGSRQRPRVIPSLCRHQLAS